MKKWLLFFLLSFSLSLEAVSVVLWNDSPFDLIAEVHASDGSLIEVVPVPAGNRANWVQNFGRAHLTLPSHPSGSLTPFTVVWKCSYQGLYSVCSDVAPGSIVKANDCPGSRSCTPKPEKEKCPDCICPAQK